ncbi:NADP-dependent 3-hydroxy acid dehydrogenase YdfG [Ruminococcaceae bacterium YAD3003]|nr:NADP-dependent 3-hydroxy acid dehydrogenase YdfG [Ruminococcaceae bacterium YAD3003]
MELKTAIVTGASSGIGLATSKMLSEEGYKVYGIGRVFPEGCDFFEKRISLDIRDTDILLEKISDIKSVDLLVNGAGSAYYGLAEFNTPEQIKEMCRTDLEAPMILTSALLPKLKDTKGMVINIASVTSTRINTHGAVYGALKAGLRSYSRSLYEEVRKTGVRVVTVCPDLTLGTKLYRNADFTPSDEEGCYLVPEDVALCIKNIINMREGCAVTEVEVRPQFNRIAKKK